MRFITLFTALAVSTMSCSRDAVTIDEGSNDLRISEHVSVSRVPAGIQIVNRSQEALAFVAVDPEWLGQLALCIDQSPECLRLGAESTIIVPLADIVGYSAGTRKAVTRIWRVVSAGGGDELRAEVLGEVTVQW